MAMNRREFLRNAGLVGVAGTAACTWDPKTPVEHDLPYVTQGQDTLPGAITYFSTGCTECASMCGMVARSKEGRVVMVEGNPDHPGGQGLCTRGHMTLLATYSPDRLQSPMIAGKPASWDDAMGRVVEAVRGRGDKQVAWLGQYRTGSVARLLGELAGATNLRRVHWEALGVETLLAATRATFGVAAHPWYELSEARTILSFGMDFLGTAYGSMGMSAGWARAKDPAQGGFVTRLVCVEPRVSLTSAQADNFLAPTPGTEVHVAFAIARLAAEAAHYNGPAGALVASVDVAAAAAASGISVEKLTEIAGYVATQPSVVLPGGFANASVDATALAVASLVINEVCGNVGRSVVFGKELRFGDVHAYSDVKALLEDARAGRIAVLFLDGVNPVFNLPAGDKVAEALDAVGLLVQVANEPDDSTRPTTVMLPPGSGLEGWGDAESAAGVNTLQQAAMTPLFDTRSVGDILLALGKALVPATTAAPPVPAPRAPINQSGGDPVIGGAAPLPGTAPSDTPAARPAPVALGFGAADFKTYVMQRWRAEVYQGDGADFDAFWTATRQRGGVFTSVAPTGAAFTLASLATPSGPLAGDAKALVLFPSPHLGDGRHANRPWAQEVPDPISTTTWTTWAEVNPKTAEQLGLHEGDLVKVETDLGELRMGFFASPGVREDTVAVMVGNGHTGMGRYATNRGVNPMAILPAGTDPVSGALVTYATRARVTRAGPADAAFQLVGNMDQDGRFLANVCAATDAVEHLAGEPGSIVLRDELPELDRRLLDKGLTDMFPEPQHPTYRFAMAIDTNVCTGCSACVVACNLENNVPFVGPDQVRKGRMMSWIRMDRFWEGEGEHQDVRHMPSLCQHCSHAPCEGVCPVLATYHNLDGLNAMVYNRCVGTRYCGNNCPYTARRFNFHTWTWPESMHLMLNPDVTVREMGVMEKCTFCVQRTRAAKDAWRDMDHAVVPDTALRKLTACAAACPTGAITFGNAKDHEGTLGRLFENPRAYTLLGELNTKPGIRYLARARHHVAEALAHHAAGADGDQDGAHEKTDESHGAPARGEG
jgi:anaerobic selenocysteine-containing dehydrogenase/Fe-S-cluster-containing dehydrogenase component